MGKLHNELPVYNTMGVKSQRPRLSVCSNECELTVRRGRSRQFTHVAPLPPPPQVLPTPSEIGGAVAWGMSTSGEQLPPPSPFPQPNCAVKWAKSTAASGSFAFIENYSELTLTRNASANGPGRLELSLTGHFEARSYLQYLKEGELGAAAGCQAEYFTQLV